MGADVTLTYSPEWKGFRWDVERVLADLFTIPDNTAAQWVNGLEVVPWFPPNEKREAWLQQGNGYLWVHRVGGELNVDTSPGVDEAITQMAALTKSRDDSNELLDYVASVLCAFGKEGGLVHRSRPHRSGTSTTFMRVPGEVVGPQFIPDRFRDERLIPAQWATHVDLPRGLPDYRDQLGLEW